MCKDSMKSNNPCTEKETSGEICSYIDIQVQIPPTPLLLLTLKAVSVTFSPNTP